MVIRFPVYLCTPMIYSPFYVRSPCTEINRDVTSGNGHYGLLALSTSSIIHLLFPLTKESVSTNNHNDQNYGSAGGSIDTVNSFD